jgi:putative phage-type endonuclease
MGESPWRTPYQLWEEKLDLCPPRQSTAQMQRGHDLEEEARQKLCDLTGIFFLPHVKFHPEFPWMMASLDGIDPEGTCIAEIKCPGQADHAIAVAGQVPDKYFAQLQHQLEVSQTEMCYYYSYDGTNGVLVKVEKDDAYIKKMIKKESAFWECVQSLTPPEFTERDYVKKDDELWKQAASDWIQLNNQIKSLESRATEIRETLIAMSQKKNCMGAGIKISRSIRKANIDYSQIPELQQINLEKYRKKPIEYWKIISVD